MPHPSAIRLVPDCRVSVGGKKLDVAMGARLTRVEVDLDVDLFGQCVLVFNDAGLTLINGKEFQSGTAVKVEIGFASKLQRVFEGEVVALEPQFRRDLPPSLRVVCQEGLHRLALSQMTRAFNDVDDKEIVGKIATEHGLSGEAPAGSKQHVLQGNVTDAVFLRRLAQKQGNHLRIEGKKLIIGPPPRRATLTIGPGDGTRKVKVKIQTRDQIEEIAVHGYDPKTKKEFVGKAKGQGVTGEGARKYGKGKTLSFAGHEHPPVDTATAEAMAKGRMRKLAEGHVTASVEAIGDPGMLPGATVKLEKLGAQIDGSYRVERAQHQFSKHGYWVNLKLVRTAKAAPPAKVKPAPPPPAPAPAAAPPPEPDAEAPPRGAASTGAGGTAPAGTAPASGTPATGAAATPAAGAAATPAASAAPAAGTRLTLSWEPAQGFCGDTVKLKGVTENLADGTAVTITLRPKQGASPRLAASLTATVSGNKLEQTWRIANVDFGSGASALSQVEIEASSTGAAAVTAGVLLVTARSDGASAHFSENRTWSGFTAHPRFDQLVERFRNKVAVTAEIMKCWGATYINMARAGITGTAGGCPWADHRWGRNTSPTGSMQPNQYYDGTSWKPLPAGFTPNAAEYFSVAFYKDGSSFASPSTGTYPDAFADYDFNDSAYTAIRDAWVTRTHDRWTEKFALRRSGCPSDPGVNCCKYDVEVNLTFSTVTSHGADTILVGPGNYRSNASTFFMGDTRTGTVPHEIGHLMDNPDEYQYGAVDTSINGDGATNGIDPDCIMGQNLSDVKKRHYHAFAVMLRRIIKTAYGSDDAYDTVAR